MFTFQNIGTIKFIRFKKNQKVNKNKRLKMNNIVLVCGMAFVNNEYEVKSRITNGVTSAVLRDRARLLRLEKNHKLNIITMNDTHSETICEPKKHICGSFSARTIKNNYDFLKENAPLKSIFLDYFRFPSSYMIKAYKPFITEMIPALLEKSAIDLSTEITLPNFPPLMTILENQKLFSFKIIRFLDAKEYILFSETEFIDSEYLGGYKNVEQIKQLDKIKPFVVITVSKLV